MKTLMLLGVGFADRPHPELDGKTPLQAARTPALDRLAEAGEAGGWMSAPAAGGREEAAETVTALQGLFGCRELVPSGPLEAAGAGIDLRDGEIAFSVNFVCLKATPMSLVLFDPAGGGISDEEGKDLAGYIEEKLVFDAGEEARLHALGGHRAVLTYWNPADPPAKGAGEGFPSPHAIAGKDIAEHLPTGAASRRFVHLVNDSQMILSAHPELVQKLQNTMFAANSLWLWGGGGRPAPAPLSRLAAGRAAVISASPGMGGLARLWGAADLRVEERGAAGRRARVEAARKAFGECDLVLLSCREADDASHRGEVGAKVSAIEAFDAEVAAPILADPGAGGPCRIIALCDHISSCQSGGHVPGPVPYAVADWAGGRLAPPKPPGGLRGLLRRISGRAPAAGNGEPLPEGGFSERLCGRGRPLSPKSLRGHLRGA